MAMALSRATADTGRQLLGVRFDALTLPEVRARVRQSLESSRQLKIFTPNPEMLVKAHSDSFFKKILNRADIALCDGHGTELALRRTYPKDHIARITGADFTLELASLCAQQKKSLFLLGGESGVALKAARKLTTLFPSLIIAGTDSGPLIHEDSAGRLIEPENGQEECIKKIQNAAPDAILVAFGMGKQEKWIDAHMAELPSVKVAVGVGGTFDFLAGSIPRAPASIRRLGLEWLFRLFQEPRRVGRIWRATVVFSWLLARELYKKTEPHKRFS